MQNPNKLTRQERETIIRKADDQDTWNVFSESPRDIRRFTKRWGPGTQVSSTAVVWTVDEKLLSPRSPRTISDEERAKRAERMRQIRANG